MPDCARFAPMIGALRGELPPDEARALEAHLVSCVTCSAFAADVAVVDGLVRDGLIAKANARDFAPFVDQVMARVEAQGSVRASTPRPLRGRSAQHEREVGHGGGPLAWLGRHRRAFMATLVPVLATAVLVVYVRLQGGQPSEAAMFELASEGDVTMVLQTADGPVVLLGAEEPTT